MRRKSLHLGLASVVGLVALLVIAPAAGARAYNTKYVASGWTSSKSHSGLCLESLTCPSISNSTSSTKGGAVLTTDLGALLGVGARSTSTWTSGAFQYTGAEGRLAKKVKVTVLRSANTGDFLDVAGNSATYSVSIVNAKNGVVVAQPVANATQTQASSFTKVGPKWILPNLLRRDKSYKVQITSTFVNGAEVIPGATVSYTGARVIAKTPKKKRHHHH
jgi:hypothetical protein